MSNNKILFKSRKYAKITIEIDDFESIEIKLELILVDIKENKHKINFENSTKYEDRLQLKSNFEKLKDKLRTAQV